MEFNDPVTLTGETLLTQFAIRRPIANRTETYKRRKSKCVENVDKDYDFSVPQLAQPPEIQP